MGDRAELLNDVEEANRLMMDGRQAVIWSAIPGIITKVDLTKMTVEVQPAIQGSVTDQDGRVQFVNLPILADVPIVFPSAGGFSITFPIAIGDEVLVVFSSRCIDQWWQSGGIQKPMEARMHDLSDGFAIPGPRSQPNVLSGVSATNLQIRNNANSVKIEVTAAGAVNILASTVAITGNLTVSGTIVSTGEISKGAIGLSTHKHSGVSTGGGTSGGPVP